MTTNFLSKLKIHALSHKQYDREQQANRIDDNALYIKPGEDYYTRPEVDELLLTKASTVPTFDINEMGFPDITKKNELLVADTIDVSALRDALGKGPVKILYTVEGKQYGEVVSGGGYLDDLIYNIELRSYGKIFIGVAETAIIGGWVSDIPGIDIQEDNGKIIAVENGEYVLQYPKEGVSSWNDLTDKPFGDGVEIAIDPATFEPTDIIEWGEFVLCSLTDQITTKEDVLGATLSGTIGGQNLSLQFTQDNITYEDDNILIAFIYYEDMELPIFIAAAAGTYTIQPASEPITITVPDKGFYTFAEVLEVFTSISLTKPTKKIDEKYLPATSITTVTDDGEGNVILTNVAIEEDTTIEETDPTVPAWAKASTKPSYTAEEVSARPNTWIPTPAEIGAASSADLGALQTIVSGLSGGAKIATDFFEQKYGDNIVTLDFAPKFVMICSSKGMTILFERGNYMLQAGNSSNYWTYGLPTIGITSTGFNAYKSTSGTVTAYYIAIG